jgi:TIR domain
MRISEKLALIDKIGRELQSRFRYDEIDTFLAEYKINPPGQVGYNSKWVYSKVALQGITNDVLLKIAEELDINVPHAKAVSSVAPRNWKDSNQFRLFISHISKDKDKATRLKECLSPYAISGFVAHEDIHPTLEWQKEIERALHVMDAFIAIHTLGFSKSFWTQQEIGFAVGRGVKIISFKMGEDPTGFISQHQALARRARSAEDIAKEIDAILKADDLTASKLLEAKKANGLIAADDEVPF